MSKKMRVKVFRVSYLLTCSSDFMQIFLCLQEKKGTEDWMVLQVLRVLREKPAHAPPPAKVSRVHRVYKAPLDQLEPGACLESRDLWDPKVLLAIRVTWVDPATPG